MNRQPVTKISISHIEGREGIISSACQEGYITDQEKGELLFLERLLTEETDVTDE